MNAQRHFPATGLRGAIEDRTALPRLGLRGWGTPDWCTANALPFPNKVNTIARANGLRIARLGTYELLVLPDGATQMPAVSGTGVYSGYRDETWAWFRLSGPHMAEALSTLTAADLRPETAPQDSVVQTRFAGLDAVLIIDADAVDVFVDIASVEYVLGVFADRCPQML